MRVNGGRLLLSATLLAGSLAGCAEAPADIAEEGTVLYFEPIGYGQSASISDTVEIAIRDDASWRSYRDSLNPIAPFDAVDFSQAIVLLAALPQTRSGYILEFESVDEYDSVAVAEYLVSIPGSDCLTSHANAVPFQAVLVRRTENPVRFESRTEEYRCTFGPPRR